MNRPGVFLEQLTWDEAEPLLRGDPLIVLPVGAAAKEHGPHLPLGTDRLVAEHLAARLAERVAVIVLPTVAYGYYPAFTEFPGSTHLSPDTFGALVREIVLSIGRHGPRRFLVLNTGISTTPVLEVVARELHRAHHLLVGVTRIEDLGARQLASLLSQPAGSHADEYETSLVLAIAPQVVRRSKAAREIPARPRLRGLIVPSAFRREPGPDHSATGVYGDATLATPEKGAQIDEALVGALVEAAEYLRTAPMD